MNHTNTIIKTMFADSSKKQFHGTLDMFWNEYNDFNHNNEPFDSKKLYAAVKIFKMVIIICVVRNTL